MIITNAVLAAMAVITFHVCFTCGTSLRISNVEIVKKADTISSFRSYI